MLKTITAREEDYLKAIFTLANGTDTAVAPGALVERLAVSSAAVSRMTRQLAKAGLVRRMAYQGVSLTFEGRQHALRVLRFHRLAEVFLVEQLGYDWADVDDTVDEMEHAMTEKLANRLEAFLNFPASCPHGDPIPNANLELRAVRERPLTTLAVGQPVVISRVTGETAMFRYLKEQALTPGTSLTLHRRADVGGLLMIERNGETIPLTSLVAGAIFVRRPEEGRGVERERGREEEGEKARVAERV
ncbi:MAG: metal-dependent transcriptional regulator [Ardenticatenaceae bacterium]